MQCCCYHNFLPECVSVCTIKLIILSTSTYFRNVTIPNCKNISEFPPEASWGEFKFVSVTVIGTLFSEMHFCPVNNISVFDSRTSGQVQATIHWKLWDMVYLPTARVRNKEPRHTCLANSCAFAFPQFTLNSTLLIITCFNIGKTYRARVLSTEIRTRMISQQGAQLQKYFGMACKHEKRLNWKLLLRLNTSVQISNLH